MRFPVRLACSHLILYRGSYPRPGDIVYCTRCEAGQVALYWYFDPKAPSSWCGAECETEFARARCTHDADHSGDHEDEPLGIVFPARFRAITSAAAGLCH